MKIHYATNPMKIGKHEWRCLVVDVNFLGRIERCTRYQFRAPGGNWQVSSKWPSYNHNDTYDGLPKSVYCLYEKNYPQIQAYLQDLTLFSDLAIDPSPSPQR